MDTKKFNAYSIGLCSASVCTNMTNKEATDRLNAQYTTGISSKWKISRKKKFDGGKPHPFQCPDDESCRHILFNC